VGNQGPHPNQWHVETQVPAIQTEQAADDVAPVMAEYVPAKASREEYGLVDSKTSAKVKSRRLGGENTFTVERSVNKTNANRV
jgi:hypothetical protein